MMKKIMMVIFYVLIGLVLFAGLYYVSDYVLSKVRADKPELNTNAKNITAYVLSNGVHTDLVLPIKNELQDWTKIFPVENTKGASKDFQFVSIGWGDKGFYLNTPEWKDLTLKTALVAGLGIGETALHVTYYRQMREDDLCHKVQIDSNQFEILKSYILNSLDKDSAGKPILVETNAQYGSDDAFYEAKGSYSLFYSCNTWANNGLKKANMPSGVWTVFDTGILQHYQK